MARILVVDDHPVVREGFKRILASNPGFKVAGEASSLKETLEKVRSESWDLVLLDVTLPDVNGVDALSKIRAARSKLPVVVICGDADEDLAAQVLREGALGFLTKDCSGEQIVSALEKVMEGGRFISPSVVEGLTMRLLSRPDKAPHEALSDREMQVLGMIVSGKKPKEIAEDLGLSIKTVSTHRTRILQKMQMRSNAELVRYAMKHKLTLEDKGKK